MQSQIYQLSGRTTTTGWNNNLNVNQKNEYGMTPAQVAVQAGNIGEFAQIINHPEFQSEKMGTLGKFMQVLKSNDEDLFARFQEFFKSVFCAMFQFSKEQDAWVRVAA